MHFSQKEKKNIMPPDGPIISGGLVMHLEDVQSVPTGNKKRRRDNRFMWRSSTVFRLNTNRFATKQLGSDPILFPIGDEHR